MTSVFAFIYSWNELLYASILTSFNAKTIPVVVAGFISDQFLRWGEMTAIGSIMIIPVCSLPLGRSATSCAVSPLALGVA